MTFEVTILGSNSALPAHGRHPSAQIVNIQDKLYLIDCGEGTQIRMDELKIRRHRINHIFITHLHGDHYFGLIGLINSYNLLGRRTALNIYACKALEEITIHQLQLSDTVLRFPLIFHTLEEEEAGLIYEDKTIQVSAVKLFHRIPCLGFVFREQPQPRIIRGEMIEKYQIPYSLITGIRQGADFTTASGEKIDNGRLTLPPYKARSYAYISDTAYNESIVASIRGVDLLYHEATFGEDSRERAAETFHSTARQAATIAMKAGVSRLIIGHFSSKYKNLDHLLEEARAIFPHTELALEGKVFEIEREQQASS